MRGLFNKLPPQPSAVAQPTSESMPELDSINGIKSYDFGLSPSAASEVNAFMNPAIQSMRAQRIADLTRPEVATMVDDVIPAAEGGAYNKRVGGGTFDDYSRHPGPTANGNSAAGISQMTEGTWNDMRKSMYLPTFSPFNQRMATVGVLDREKALEPLRQNNLPEALYRMTNRRTFDALPPGGKHQTMTYDEVEALYNEGLKYRRGY